MKDYLSPQTVAAQRSTPVTKSVSAEVSVKSAVPAGLHVRAVTHEGGNPVEVDSFFLFPEGTSFDEPKPIARSDYGVSEWSTPAAPGRYVVRAEKGPLIVNTAVEIAQGEGLSKDIVLNAGIVVLKAKMSETGQEVKVDKFFVVIPDGTGEERNFDADYSVDVWKVMVPAGTITVGAQRGSATARKSIGIKPGEIYQETLVMNAGALEAVVTLTQGSERIRVDEFMVELPGNSFDDPKVLTSDYSNEKFVTSLPQGKYKLKARVGAAEVSKDIEIQAGQVLQETLVLDAGMLEAIATGSSGGERMTVESFYVKKQGNQFDEPKVLESVYNQDKFSLILPQGQYILGVTSKGGAHEVPIQIDAGKKLQQEVVLSAMK